MSMNDRMGRAQDYVLGLMDEHERQRAEREMEVDPEFRECVLVLAERMRRINREKPPAVPESAWAEISDRIARMPHLAPRMGAAGAPVSDAASPRLAPGIGKPIGQGLHSTGNRTGTTVALALAAAFALGYLAGRFGIPVP